MSRALEIELGFFYLLQYNTANVVISTRIGFYVSFARRTTKA